MALPVLLAQTTTEYLPLAASATPAAAFATTTAGPGTRDPFYLEYLRTRLGLGSGDLFTIVTNIITVALNFLALIFLIMVLFAGLRWMTSGGDEEKVQEAKQTLKNAIIGVIIIFISQAIVQFVFGALGAATPAVGEPL